MTDAGDELHWTADGRSAMEVSALGWRLSVAPRIVVTGGLLWAVVTVVYANSAKRTGGEPYPWTYGLVHGAVIAGVYAVVIAVCGFALLVLGNRNRLRARTELTAVWGSDSVLFVSPLAEVRIPLSTIKEVRVHAFWVAVQQSDNRIWVIWPRELFPDSQLARLPVLGAEPAAG